MHSQAVLAHDHTAIQNKSIYTYWRQKITLGHNCMCCTATLHYFIALLVQHTNQAILERFMLTSEQAPTEVVIPDLSEDERSALYYAAGYVPFALRKRFKEIRFVCAVDHLYSSYNIIVLYNFRPDLISILLRFDAWDECGDADTLHDYMRHAEK